MKKIRQTITGFLVAVGLVGFSLAGAAPAGALDPTAAGCRVNPSATICQNNAGNVDAFIKNLVRILLWAIGIISVIMIIIGGIRYVMSQGDTSNVQQAKNTILYAVIGLVVALLSYTIVDFVLGYL